MNLLLVGGEPLRFCFGVTGRAESETEIILTVAFGSPEESAPGLRAPRIRAETLAAIPT